MNSIVDELKESLEQSGLVGNLTPAHICAVMATAFVCGMIIYIIYRAFYRGAVYNESFNILNVMTCMITAFIIMTISSNLVLSLGMVGALSIVRFRAAVKDPLDIGFLFLAIAAGLTSGAGLFPLALIATMVIAAIYIILTVFGKGRKTFIMVIKYNNSAKESVEKEVSMLHSKLKSCVCYDEVTELTVTVKIKKMDISIPDKLKKIDGVNSAVLMEYVGD